MSTKKIIPPTNSLGPPESGASERNEPNLVVLGCEGIVILHASEFADYRGPFVGRGACGCARYHFPDCRCVDINSQSTRDFAEVYKARLWGDKRVAALPCPRIPLQHGVST